MRLGPGWIAGYRIIAQADRTQMLSTFPQRGENSRGKRIQRRSKA
jgi:hypothetical protein